MKGKDHEQNEQSGASFTSDRFLYCRDLNV